MPIEHIRLSQQAKDQLLKLKRRTKIQHWNVLCRWAFCISLAEPGIPPPTRIPADSSVEMTWKVFGGPYADIYLALLKKRCREDGLETTEEVLATQFRLHLHRGIGYLAADREITSIAGMFKRLPLTIPD
jgi:DNA sulfur modification protein DndE